MDAREVIDRLEELASPGRVAFKAEKFGISARHALGVDQKELAVLARELKTDNDLAIALFDTGIYEARLLCSKIFDPRDLSEALMERWVVTFENWEICDSFCMGFFAKSAHALEKIERWSCREELFVKRAAFSIIASYGFAHKEAGNEIFAGFLPLITRAADDERHYVKKAVNWALRNIGKRNRDLHREALRVAMELRSASRKTTRWIGSDAARELEKPGTKMLDYPRSIYRPAKRKDR
jgi:3-methyladenine DNA glycosylase AlkD